MPVWFEVLGPIRGLRDGVELPLGSPQQRVLLAVLLTAAGEPVAAGVISDVLWSGDPPQAAAATVQQYVSRLRRVAGPIGRTAAGYRLDVDSDLRRYRTFLGQARDLAAAGRTAAAVDAYAAGLGLWTAPAGTGLPAEARAHPVFADLDREHAAVLAEAADAALDAGRGAVLAPVLECAAGWHPYDEGLQARLLRTLAAAGRTTDALDHFRAARERLVGELGIEPGPLLRDAHRAVTAPAVVRPAQLPTPPVTFTGRTAELARLDAIAGPRPLVLVGGLGGVGKTSLALHWAHRAAPRYPDGQLYVDLRGFAPSGVPLSPVEALHGFLEALGVPRSNQPATLDGLSALYRSVLAGRKILVVLDNARDDEQVRPLLPGTAGCAVLVTSRSYLGGLSVDEDARSVGLDVFRDSDALGYLRSRLGAARVDAEPWAAAEIVRVCGGLPLALAICAAWAERSPAYTLATVAAELRRRDGLDAFAAVNVGRDVRTVFSWSYRRLGADAAELFRRLGRHPGPDVPLATAISAAGRTSSETLGLLAELTDAQLLSEPRPGRYAAHDLVRAYALEIAADDREGDLVRILDHYLHSVIAGARLTNPYRRQRDPGTPAAGVVPFTPVDVPDAVAWFDAERENLSAALDAADRAGLDEYVWLLCWGMNGFLLDHLGRWDEAIPFARTALAAARRRGDVWWRGYLHNVLGNCYHRAGDHEQAHREWSLAAAVGRESGDPIRIAIGLGGMASVLTERDEWPDGDSIERAAGYADEMRALLADIDRAGPPGRADGRTTHARDLIGFTYRQTALRVLHRTGDVEAAVAERAAGIAVHESIENWLQVQNGWQQIGRMREHAGDPDGAVEAYEKALSLGRNDEWITVELLARLAGCHARLGHEGAAAHCRAGALERLDGVYHPSADRLRALLPPPRP
ncbi:MULTISPECIES: AfsR/SARP family transcriptional regulator [Catenuloplanes]|uniref:DNA-binding SARP family transcriptional activator/tetratricopeptide (TPR) repeat protein n=1 Tax=Catenuloplanes niger TaxID=587534 RepID=A0AAE4CZM3_9ACTN|nr:BTAD domain-containing putative transcriptional regulator [Catenuloplanes niger]MDR7327044.1 DNA-binding SARP family transcriptional activator/tetratricopeptide (TPR) repeat protein [Catenuloplanes niger]